MFICTTFLLISVFFSITAVQNKCKSVKNILMVTGFVFLCLSIKYCWIQKRLNQNWSSRLRCCRHLADGHPHIQNSVVVQLVNPYATLALTPYTIAEPAIVNILAAVPRIIPSACVNLGRIDSCYIRTKISEIWFRFQLD